jgi:hypothetical protein
MEKRIIILQTHQEKTHAVGIHQRKETKKKKIKKRKHAALLFSLISFECQESQVSLKS